MMNTLPDAHQQTPSQMASKLGSAADYKECVLKHKCHRQTSLRHRLLDVCCTATCQTEGLSFIIEVEDPRRAT